MKSNPKIKLVSHSDECAPNVYYANMVSKPLDLASSNSRNQVPLVHYATISKDRDWLEKYFVVIMKEEFNWEDHTIELKVEYCGSLMLKYLGGNIVLVQKCTNNPMEAIEKD